MYDLKRRMPYKMLILSTFKAYKSFKEPLAICFLFPLSKDFFCVVRSLGLIEGAMLFLPHTSRVRMTPEKIFFSDK